MNQRKRRQKEPSKDIFDNLHMSKRLKILDKLTEDLDSMVKNPSNYRISDEIIALILDNLNNSNFEIKIRPLSSKNTNSNSNSSSDSSVEPIKLTSGHNESNNFGQIKSSPNIKTNGHYTLNGQEESEQSRLKLNLLNDGPKRKNRQMDNSELNNSAIDFTPQLGKLHCIINYII